jgi:fructoselysine and glucoselysine-specific PTS system IIB component
MIKLFRVDDRLIHGQVAATWTNSVGADCILIAKDNVAPLEITAFKLSVPSGMKLVIKSVDDSINAINSGVTDRYNLLIVVASVTDAYRLMKGCKVIKELDLGRTVKREGMESLSNSVHITAEQKEMLKELASEGYKIYLQTIPTAAQVPLEKVLK